MSAAFLGRRFLSADPAMVERFGDPFRPLEPNCQVIQFSQPLTPAQLQQAADELFGEETYYVKVDTTLPERQKRAWERKSEPGNGEE